MLISEEHNFLFVHIPKGAGTSIGRALKPYSLNTKKEGAAKLISKLHLDFNWRHHHFRTHTSLQEAQRQIPSATFEQLFKFAVVRNPWDKLVSSFHFQQQRDGHEVTKFKVSRMEFSEFLEHAIKKRDRKPLAFSQKRRIVLKDGEIGTDMTLRLENLEQDWEELSAKIALPVKLPTANKSQHRDYREYYSDKDIEFVAKHWQEDIETFGYTF